MAIDGSGNAYVTGESLGSDGFSDYATIKYDNLGQQQWVARYNGTGNGNDGAAGIGIHGSGNVYVTGGSAASDGFSDYATIKYNSLGQQQWASPCSFCQRVGDNAFHLVDGLLLKTMESDLPEGQAKAKQATLMD